MRPIPRVVVAGLALAAAGAVVLTLARSRAVPPEARGAPFRPIRGFMSHRLDPVVLRLGLAGGSRSPWGLIEHVGRASGVVRRTPVEPMPMPDGWEIPLAYGADAQWVRNVLASGWARLQIHDTIVEVDHPEIVGGAEALSLSPAVRRFAARMGYRYLRLRTVATMPGTFSHLDGHAVPETRGEPIPIEAEPEAGAAAEPVSLPAPAPAAS